jgi:hypothetical protein
VFLHGSHVRTLWPKADEKEKLSTESCVSCHSKQWSSTTLDQPAKLELDVACKQCHTEQVPSAKAPSRQPESRVNFPHAKHQKVSGGCFACHEFKGKFEGDPEASPVKGVADDILNCTKCHAGHKEVAGGACVFCHPAKAEGSEKLFNGERPSRTDWPAGFKFNHFSGTATEGHISHMGQVGSPLGNGCKDCHELDQLKSAARVSAVHLPGGGGELCIQCHAFNRGWFHWSLPDSKPR